MWLSIKFIIFRLFLSLFRTHYPSDYHQSLEMGSINQTTNDFQFSNGLFPSIIIIGLLKLALVFMLMIQVSLKQEHDTNKKQSEKKRKTRNQHIHTQHPKSPKASTNVQQLCCYRTCSHLSNCLKITIYDLKSRDHF